jgi:hypothetical protein
MTAPTNTEENEKIVEKIEVVINRHSPMDNFDIKENCARDIFKEAVLPHTLQTLERVRSEVEKIYDSHTVAEVTDELGRKFSTSFYPSKEKILSLLSEEINTIKL